MGLSPLAPPITISSTFLVKPGCPDAAERYRQVFPIRTPGPLPGAVVGLRSRDHTPDPPRELRVTFRDCEITPPVLFARRGDKVFFHSESRSPHMPSLRGNSSTPPPVIQVLIPGQADLELGQLPNGRYQVYAPDMPDWATSELWVLPNQNTWVTDSAGHFRLDGLAVGSTEVNAWYPGTRPVRETVALVAGETKRLELHLVPASNGDGGVESSDGGAASPGDH